MIVKLRYDDECNNGHNCFSITASLFDREQRIPYEASTTLSTGKKRWLGGCGCLHEEIVKRFPELEKYIKWHLCSSDGPMHYIANSLYWAEEGNLESFRSTAIWPGITEEELNLHLSTNALEIILKNRLPALMDEFKAAMEELKFVY